MIEKCEPCGKRIYRTMRKAITIALRSSRDYGTGLRIYRCPRGAGFHLTTKTRAVA